MKYPYAVMSLRHGEDHRTSPESCHQSREAARKAAARMDAQYPGVHHRAVQWGAGRWGREFPSAPEDV